MNAGSEFLNSRGESIVLDARELVFLTGRKRRDAQVRALRAMGIEHRARPDGSVVVLRAHAETVLSGLPTRGKVESPQPDWSSV